VAAILSKAQLGAKYIWEIIRKMGANVNDEQDNVDYWKVVNVLYHMEDAKVTAILVECILPDEEVTALLEEYGGRWAHAAQILLEMDCQHRRGLEKVTRIVALMDENLAANVLAVLVPSAEEMSVLEDCGPFYKVSKVLSKMHTGKAAGILVKMSHYVVEEILCGMPRDRMAAIREKMNSMRSGQIGIGNKRAQTHADDMAKRPRLDSPV